jgi:hypothetical protein
MSIAATQIDWWSPRQSSARLEEDGSPGPPMWNSTKPDLSDATTYGNIVTLFA